MGKELLFRATKKDFRIDTFKSGGPGGQHQNKTNSGVRITHLPTGLSAECREQRSQRQNKRVAFRKLAAQLAEKVRAGLRTMPERSEERIRTYHMARNEVKDHASGFVQSYDEVVQDIGPMIDARRKALLTS